MLDSIVRELTNESRWLAAAMLVAALCAVRVFLRLQRGRPRERALHAALNVLYGVMMGIMGTGHVLGVALYQMEGKLSSPAWLLYPLGVALAVPGWILGARGSHWLREREADDRGGRLALLANAWLALFLLALGPHNLPLALPGLLNVAFELTSRRRLGWLLLASGITTQAVLFVGSLVFFASGQSFEDFRGLE